jgi:hypothetical protein
VRVVENENLPKGVEESKKAPAVLTALLQVIETLPVFDYFTALDFHLRTILDYPHG